MLVVLLASPAHPARIEDAACLGPQPDWGVGVLYGVCGAMATIWIEDAACIHSRILCGTRGAMTAVRIDDAACLGPEMGEPACPCGGECESQGEWGEPTKQRCGHEQLLAGRRF